MKLKKIASLALAGVMAVSMLAGCKGTDGSNNSSSTTTAASIIDAVNNGQDGANKVKVAFTADSKLEDAAKKAVAAHNDTFDYYFISNKSDCVKEIADYAAIVATKNAVSDFYKNNTATGAQPTNPAPKDGEKNVYFNVVSLGTSAASTTFLMNHAASLIDADVAKLDDTTLVTKDEATGTWAGSQTMDDDTYYDFSYTGTACLFSAPNSDGSTNYYMAYTITQTVAKKTFEV